VYAATGQKLTKQSGSTHKYYASGIEYNGNVLEAVYHAEGRVVPGGSPWKYQYAIKDHLD